MPLTKPSLDDLLGESWVDLTSTNTILNGTSKQTGTWTPVSVTGSINHQLAVTDYLRLLREAQRESNQSSARNSTNGSTRNSPEGSPTSPPNSPVQGLIPASLKLQSFFVTSGAKDGAEFINDWSSRPEQAPPKFWGFRLANGGLSIRNACVGEMNVFSSKGLCTLFLTNLISLILGTGIGLWISRHGFTVPSIKIR